jgi:signal transduction histidine kinase
VGDHTRLVQVVTNLLNNAAKYTPDGGRIDVTLSACDGYARLQVLDNGVGIGGELLPAVFELFTQATRTLDRTQGGLGLGLALVKKLVELHGGTVQARSAGLGQGSAFIVELPLAGAATQTDSGTARAA